MQLITRPPVTSTCKYHKFTSTFASKATGGGKKEENKYAKNENRLN